MVAALMAFLPPRVKMKRAVLHRYARRHSSDVVKMVPVWPKAMTSKVALNRISYPLFVLHLNLVAVRITSRQLQVPTTGAVSSVKGQETVNSVTRLNTGAVMMAFELLTDPTSKVALKVPVQVMMIVNILLMAAVQIQSSLQKVLILKTATSWIQRTVRLLTTAVVQTAFLKHWVKITKDVLMLVRMSRTVVAPTVLPLPMARIVKAAVLVLSTGVVLTTFSRPEDRTLKVAAVSIAPMDAVQTISQLPVDPRTKAAAASTLNMVAVPTNTLRPQVPISRVVRATPSSLAAALMASPELSVRNAWVAVVKTHSLDVVLMARHPPMGQMRVVAVKRRGSDVVLMERLTLRVRSLRDAPSLPSTPGKRVKRRRTVGHAATLQPSGSTIWSMVVAQDSGMEAVMAITTDLKAKKNVNKFVWRLPEKQNVHCRKLLVPVTGTTRDGTMTPRESSAVNLSMVVAWATTIILRHAKNARKNVQPIKSATSVNNPWRKVHVREISQDGALIRRQRHVRNSITVDVRPTAIIFRQNLHVSSNVFSQAVAKIRAHFPANLAVVVTAFPAGILISMRTGACLSISLGVMGMRISLRLVRSANLIARQLLSNMPVFNLRLWVSAMTTLKHITMILSAEDVNHFITEAAEVIATTSQLNKLVCRNVKQVLLGSGRLNKNLEQSFVSSRRTLGLAGMTPLSGIMTEATAFASSSFMAVALGTTTDFHHARNVKNDAVARKMHAPYRKLLVSALVIILDGITSLQLTPATNLTTEDAKEMPITSIQGVTVNSDAAAGLPHPHYQ